MTEREQIEHAIQLQESLRATLGEAVVDVTISALRQRLAALPRSQVDQRKQMTILFADVSGFTSLWESIDVEELKELMRQLWERIDAVIVEHGGRIDKHIGDAVMALWSAETTREDDPEHAIRAALAMQVELGEFTETYIRKQVPTEFNFKPVKEVPRDVRMRIGINTGPVLLGALGSIGEITVMGDAVNLASRLEHAAPVGGILISHNTYRHVRGVFDVKVL